MADTDCSGKRKRYAQVGVGDRSFMYTRAIVETYRDHCELVGICDTNRTRMDLRNEWIAGRASKVPAYTADAFDRMIAETRPDAVVVTTVDRYHHEYVIRAMELGCDVVCEKPLTTDAEKCRAILDAKRRTGRDIRVTFNYRYAPIRSAARRVIMEGTLGELRSVEFAEMLDQRHGADYFRRWHRHKANSGGLLVHKATHHFDLINWYVDSEPATVFAQGARRFATPEQADRLGLQGRGERCLGCPVAAKCRFRFDLEKREGLRRMYLEAEHEDGYFRDRCIFGDSIDIEDSMSVTVRYRSGVLLTYSLDACLPWEGYRLIVNGTEGRLEMFVKESSYVSGDGTTPGALDRNASTLKVFPLFGEPYDVPMEEARGGHSGGDEPLLEDVFSATPPPDPLHRVASEVAGAYAALTGIAANESIATGRPVEVAALLA